MNDTIKKFFLREKEEIAKNKVRVGILIGSLVIGIFALIDFDDGEEINLSEAPPPVAEEKISADKTIPDAVEISNENVTAVIGANAEKLFVRDPFKVEEKIPEPELAEKKVEPPKAQEILPQQIFSPSPPQKNSQPAEPEDKFVLTGTAITSSGNTALVQQFKGKNLSGTLILSVGDTLKGRRITSITENYLTLDGGEKIYIDLR